MNPQQEGGSRPHSRTSQRRPPPYRSSIRIDANIAIAVASS